MNLSMTGEQRELVNWAVSIAQAQFPVQRFQPGARVSDRAALDQLAGLGWFGLGAAEAEGGAGLSVIEEVQVMQAAGQFLPAPSLLAGVVATGRGQVGGDQAASGAGAFEGEPHRVALALPVRSATNAGEILIVEAEGAKRILVIGDGWLELLPAASIGPMRALPCLDDALSLHSATAPHLGAWSATAASPQWLRAQILLCALLVGAGEGALAMAVEYAKLRQQFGKLIGAFQAVAHKAADVALQLASARSQMTYAALALREGRPDADFQVRAARLLAGSAATAASYANVQIHGGIGFTSECHAQRFVKRVAALDMFGKAPHNARQVLLAGPVEQAA